MSRPRRGIRFTNRLKAVFTAAKVGGVKNYFVELEEDPALMPPSVPFLKSLNV